MYDDICARIYKYDGLRDCCHKKSEQARDSHFSAFIVNANIIIHV